MERNDVSKMSALSLYSEALKLRLGHEISPRMAIIHPTNQCNHRCTGCEYSNVHTSKPAKIEGMKLLQLVDEVADLGVASILFSGGGEPTMHKSFASALERAKQRKLSVGIFSNGTFIDQGLSEHIARNATFIRVSIDAANPDTYASIRQVSDSAFDKLKLNIRSLIEAKSQLGSKLEVGLKFLVRPCNIEEIPSFVMLANELGVESVQYKPLRNDAEEPDADQIKRARELIEQSKISGLDSGVKIQGGISPKIRVKIPCWISPLRVVIAADGDVHLCNYFNHRRETHTFGNINQKPLRDIWFSDGHRQALASIKQPECALYDCRFHDLNPELLGLVEGHRNQLDFI